MSCNTITGLLFLIVSANWVARESYCRDDIYVRVMKEMWANRDPLWENKKENAICAVNNSKRIMEESTVQLSFLISLCC